MDSEEGIPASEPVEENSNAEETGAGNVNYHDRIRVEPDFAVDEVRKKDKYINELHMFSRRRDVTARSRKEAGRRRVDLHP